MIRPRAKRQGADLRVEGPQVKIQLAEPDKLRGRHPQHLTVVIDDARGVAVMLDRARGAAEMDREAYTHTHTHVYVFSRYLFGVLLALSAGSEGGGENRARRGGEFAESDIPVI